MLKGQSRSRADKAIQDATETGKEERALTGADDGKESLYLGQVKEEWPQLGQVNKEKL